MPAPDWLSSSETQYPEPGPPDVDVEVEVVPVVDVVEVVEVVDVELDGTSSQPDLSTLPLNPSPSQSICCIPQSLDSSQSLNELTGVRFD